MLRFILLSLMSFLMAIPAIARDKDPIAEMIAVIHEKQAVAEWIIQRTRNKVDYSYAIGIVDTVYDKAYKQGVDPLVVIGMISKESMFRPKAKSGYGAVGLMQVVPRFHQDKIKKRNIYNKEVNIEVGVKVLFDCLKNRKTVKGALNCYSGGARGYAEYVQARHKEIKQAIILNLFNNNQKINVDYAYHKPLREPRTTSPLYAGI